MSNLPRTNELNRPELTETYWYLICYDNDNDNESNFIAMNYINHNTRDIQARLIDGK